MIAKNKIRPALEIALELFSIFFYIWHVERDMSPWFRPFFFWIACVGFPIFCIGLEQREFPEFGLDWEQFLKAVREIVWFTLIGTTSLAALSIYLKEFNYDGKILNRVAEYFFWAFLQEIGFQTFLTRRVQKIVQCPYGVALISSTCFSLIHFPNPALVLLTWIGGIFWSLSFQKNPNLYALSVSHGWLAVVTLYCVPAKWVHSLRIGPGYWNF